MAQLDDPEGHKSLRDEVLDCHGGVGTAAEPGHDRTPSSSRVFPQIEKFLSRIADLKKSNFFLEQKSGAMLSRDRAFRLVQEIIEIVVEELDGIPGYEEIMDRIIDRHRPSRFRHAGNSEPETE